MTGNLLSVRGLSVSFKGIKAISGLSFSVRKARFLLAYRAQSRR